MTKDDLIEWRKREAISQEIAAQRLGCSVSTFRNWEQGRRALPSILQMAIAGVEATDWYTAERLARNKRQAYREHQS